LQPQLGAQADPDLHLMVSDDGPGVEPEDLESICLTLSPIVEASLDKMCRLALEELDKLGVEAFEKEEAKTTAPI